MRARSSKLLERSPDLEAVARRFKVLSVPMRLALLHALQKGEMTVLQLAAAVGTSQPNVSKHLGVLVTAGLVGRREQGATTWCRILDPTVFRLCDLVCAGAWGGRGVPSSNKARSLRQKR